MRIKERLTDHLGVAGASAVIDHVRSAAATPFVPYDRFGMPTYQLWAAIQRHYRNQERQARAFDGDRRDDHFGTDWSVQSGSGTEASPYKETEQGGIRGAVRSLAQHSLGRDPGGWHAEDRSRSERRRRLHRVLDQLLDRRRRAAHDEWLQDIHERASRDRRRAADVAELRQVSRNSELQRAYYEIGSGKRQGRAIGTDSAVRDSAFGVRAADTSSGVALSGSWLGV